MGDLGPRKHWAPSGSHGPGRSRRDGLGSRSLAQAVRQTELSTFVDTMVPEVDTDDLIDAHEVAQIIGLSQRNSVSLYQRRYPDMPRPIVDRGRGRTKLWLRATIEAWAEARPRQAGANQ